MPLDAGGFPLAGAPIVADANAVAWNGLPIILKGPASSGVSVFRVNAGSGASFVQVNDNGTMVIDADVSTGANPLVIKYNGANIVTVSFSGDVGAPTFNGSAGLFTTDTSGNVASRGNISKTGANGQSVAIKHLTELLTIAAGVTSTTTIQKPADSIILGVSVRVTAAVTCTAGFTVGDSTNATRFNTAVLVSKAVNTTDKGTKAGAYYNATAEGIIITPDTVPSDATGRVRVTIHYLEVTAPTS